MIFTKKLTIAALCLLLSDLATAANIDFNKLNNTAPKNCTNNQTKEACKNANEAANECQQVASKNEPCANLSTEDSYVEPKFSTKKPRGQ